MGFGLRLRREEFNWNTHHMYYFQLHNGHRFKSDIVHVPTYCELVRILFVFRNIYVLFVQCNQFMWHAEKILICMGCRISCHKKCHSKISRPCTATDDRTVIRHSKLTYYRF